MENRFHKLRSCRIGLALSGGAVRGLAHIGVLKALSEAGIKPSVIAGTSVGSIVGAALAAGLEWRDVADIARVIFWPSLLNGAMLERFCEKHLPTTFAHLELPFAAVATTLPSKEPIAITSGNLSTAINASCSVRFIRRPVLREGILLKDGGMACVLPSVVCRELGADFIIASDVWERGSVLRRIGCKPANPLSGRLYPSHYRRAVSNTHLLIQPSIPAAGYLPGNAAVQRMIEIGEEAARQVLSSLTEIE